MREVPPWNIFGSGCNSVLAMSCGLRICILRFTMHDLRSREICSEEGFEYLHKVHGRYNQCRGGHYLRKLSRGTLFKRACISMHSMSSWSILRGCQKHRMHVLPNSNIQCRRFKRLLQLS